MADGKVLRVPFDSLVLASVVAELQPFVGAKVQGIRQPDAFSVVIGLYSGGSEATLLLSGHPVFARAHFVTKRPANQSQPPGFCAALRARLDGARVVFARQVGFDRILEIGIEGPKGAHLLVAELMGKHANLILIGEDGRVVSAAKTVGKTLSSRPIMSGVTYTPPPLQPRPSLLSAVPSDNLADFEGASPFLIRLIGAMGKGALAEVQSRVRERAFEADLAIGHGAYPLPLAPLGIEALPKASISIALEQHFDRAIFRHEIEALRQSLVTALRRVLLARDVALGDLEQARQAGARAGNWQLLGDLVLAYGSTIQSGQRELQAWDYEGREVTITLDPEMDFKDNANRLFDKAKKAKARLSSVAGQFDRLNTDREAAAALLQRVETEERLDRLREMQEDAKARRWLHTQALPTTIKEDRPYEGHRIRELLGPQGFMVLYGENAESNDYLTLRVAKPMDWWLHVRGHTSAHVIIQTQKHPEKVGPDVMRFAAQIAAKNSAIKHSEYVPVDYTLKRYVRKPKGAPHGTAVYTNEKTIHVGTDATP